MLTLLFGTFSSCKSVDEPPVIDPPDPLTSPSHLSSQDVTYATATLSWDAVKTAESYNVRINNGDAIPVVSNTHELDGLKPDADYIWAVQAVRGDETGPWSYDAGFATEPLPDIEKPGDMSVSAITQTTAVLEWSAVLLADGYNVRINETEVFPVKSTTCTLSGMSPDTEYSWEVQALRGKEIGPWSDKMTFSTEPLPALGIPGNLVSGDLYYTSATLSWSAVEEADFYEVRLNGVSGVVAVETTFALTGLDAATQYTWSVRAIDEERIGEWAPDATFTTDYIEQINLKEILDHGYAGATAGAGTSTFRFFFHDFIEGSDAGNGYELGVNLVTAAIDDASNKPFLQIPAGTYPFSTTGGAGTVHINDYTYLESIVNDAIGQTYTVTGGKAIIAGEDNDYYMEFIVETAQRAPLLFVWDGPFVLRNPGYTPPAGETTDFGALPMYLNLIDFYSRVGFFYGVRDVYIVQGQAEGVIQDNGVLTGNGWFVGNVQFHKDPGSDGILGTGTYDIAMNNDPGFVQAGWFESFSGIFVGMWAHKIENDRMVMSIPLVSGTVLSTVSNGMYNIEIEAFDALGARYIGTIYNSEPILPPALPARIDSAAPGIGQHIRRTVGKAAVNPQSYRMKAIAQ